MASGVGGLLRKLQLYVRRLSGMMVGVDSLAARAAGEASPVRPTSTTMCLIISIEAPHEERDSLVTAAARASRCGLRVDVEHASRWPWAARRPVRAKLTEDGSCSCSLLADDADWNATTWALRPDLVPAAVATMRALLFDCPPVLRVAALWLGDQPDETREVSALDFLQLLATEGLGTRTAYSVNRDT